MRYCKQEELPLHISQPNSLALSKMVLVILLLTCDNSYTCCVLLTLDALYANFYAIFNLRPSLYLNWAMTLAYTLHNKHVIIAAFSIPVQANKNKLII